MEHNRITHITYMLHAPTVLISPDNRDSLLDGATQGSQVQRTIALPFGLVCFEDIAMQNKVAFRLKHARTASATTVKQLLVIDR